MSILRGYAPSAYGQLHYRIAAPAQGLGAKPPLLCIHSTPSTGAMWEAVMPALATDRVVLAPDTVGYGMSDPTPEPPAIADFAAALDAFMQAMAERGGIPSGPYDVMGFHTGSITATELARSRPDRIRRLVVFGLAAYDAETRAAKLEKVRDSFPEPGPDLTHVEKLWKISSGLADPRMDVESRHIAMADSLRTGSRLPWGFMAVYRYDFLQAMTEVGQPVLVMNPEDDLWEPTLRHAAGFPRGRRVDMPGVKHGVLKLETERVAACVREFLDG